ncbi:bifunctional methylenetetrahydrofolate dehydrogenase/methenyltetrahydrofolate cyclohydrolase FolD [Croceicoccus ponticola]|uniref:Bifunctional protein FolD n=1 Tax=Croceicoccus ponticola TaxID=2217664 RepID=A0A437GUE8_9SPHN|nr:bifunctional methylenetetrahydrofolate dehydrogenase/methenyltetrahydrofolate cyclohydrolase FolD [Croceicoccus ponticola]RVQ64624.1 bifunctional methylenetetrahydrofolate dehydrogenase/methenyltetrahydrofolate cyclohydrolase FolD [Croceicoccus ponticola]
MAADVIDGTAFARGLTKDLTEQVAGLAERGVVPQLAVILVGEDPASQTYVRSKIRAARSIGIRSVEHRLDAATTQGDLLSLIDRLNADAETDGILIQLPLPPQINIAQVIRAIDPAKDVDGFHPTNVGQRVTGSGGIVPCTPKGVMLLIGSVAANVEGLDALVIGASNIVGKPMADLLLAAGCTVTTAHIKTVGLPDICRRADIVVVAVGKAGLVKADWIKPGAIVIDVGINRAISPCGKSSLVGDVAFNEAVEVAGAITPVPGGVGPMTIACLMINTVQAALERRGIVIASALIATR